MKSIQEIMGFVSKPLVKQFGFDIADVTNKWGIIVNPSLAQHTRPIKITCNEDNTRSLHIAAENSTIALELKYQEPTILGKLTKSFNGLSVNSLCIRITKIHCD